MRAPNFSLPKSRLTFPLSIFALSAIFFIGYYFYYIPVNREDIHKNGFLILANIKKSIVERNVGNQMMFKPYLIIDPAKSIQENINKIQQRLDSNNIEARVLNYHISSSTLAQPPLPNSTDNIGGQVTLKDIIDGELIYTSNASNASVGVSNNFKDIAEPILQPQKKELFEAYLAFDNNGLIYKDAELTIGENISGDSLFAKNRTSGAASVKDVIIKDIDYKMFSYPLRLGNNVIIICGFIRTKAYNTKLHEIPVSFIYPIVIIFLLLIIFLPIIKFYIMGPDEHVKFTDITLGALSFFIGAPLITLTLIQVLMLWSGDIRAKENISNLANQIDSSFLKEVNNAYRQLDSLDIFISNNIRFNPDKKLQAAEANVSGLITQYISTHKNDSTFFADFDRVAWIDTDGMQRIKAEVKPANVVYLNVSERKYFKTLKDNEGYTLPGHAGSIFAIEPVKNWVNGEFRVVVSKKSVLHPGYIASLSTQMFSVTETILPPGFGFCIIDNAGQVQLHSEMNRNLSENIVEQISPSRHLKEAIASRQDNYFDEIRLYGKTTALGVQPISRMPFYLLTFYDKGYIVPINMRVFSFALLFCFFTFLICTLIWILFFRDRYTYPMLYSPMVFLKWAIPRQSTAGFYMAGVWILVLQIIMLAAFIFSSGYFNIRNFTILVMVLMFPVNVISGLFVLHYSTERLTKNKEPAQKKEDKADKAITAIIFQLLLSVLIFLFAYYKGHTISEAFIWFQLLFNVVMLATYYAPKKWMTALSKSKKTYEAQFSALASLLIICMAVLPAGMYTWYAHNQEITQSIKKHQLYLAESLQKKKSKINTFINEQDTLKRTGYYKKTIYHSGIYSIYNDSITTNALQLPASGTNQVTTKTSNR